MALLWVDSGRNWYDRVDQQRLIRLGLDALDRSKEVLRRSTHCTPICAFLVGSMPGWPPGISSPSRD
jgi:hypothetical protein